MVSVVTQIPVGSVKPSVKKNRILPPTPVGVLEGKKVPRKGLKVLRVLEDQVRRDDWRKLKYPNNKIK